MRVMGQAIEQLPLAEGEVLAFLGGGVAAHGLDELDVAQGTAAHGGGGWWWVVVY